MHKGGRIQKGWEREGQNSGEQTLDLRKGEGWDGINRVNKMDTTGTFRTLNDRELSGRNAGNSKDVVLVWINGGRKDCGFVFWEIRGGGEQLL